MTKLHFFRALYYWQAQITSEHFCFNFPQSLENWDASDPKSLVILINELVSQYKEHQRKKVEQIPRIHFEYTTLAADNNYPEFEVHVIRGQQVRVRSFGQNTRKPSRWDALTCNQALLWVTHANGKGWVGEWSNPAGRSLVWRSLSMRCWVVMHTGSLERTKESVAITQLRATLASWVLFKLPKFTVTQPNIIISISTENACNFPSQSEIDFAHATRVHVCIHVPVCTVNLILQLC